MNNKICIFLFLSSICYAQNRLVYNNNFYTVITNSANIVIENSNPNAITEINGANIISEGEYNTIKWNINSVTGNYLIPFTTKNLIKIPLGFNVTSSGTGLNSSVLFSTFETQNDDNTNYPTDVNNVNSECSINNGLNAIDRFWIIDANSYTSKPTVSINFGYDDNPNEMGFSNSINESALKAERFNSSINKWEAPAKLMGFDNANQNKVSNANVSSTDFYRSWTLVDSTSMKIIITPTITNIACYGEQTGFVELTVNSASAVTYTWSNGAFTSALINIPAGLYNVSVSDANKCFGSTSIQVSQPASALNVSLTNSIVGECNANNSELSVYASGGSPTYSYLWLPTGNNTANLFNASNGNYTLVVTDANGCMDSLTAEIICHEDLFVPQLFTPNADGKNDAFIIKGIENYPNNNLEIFNRWGNLVYKKTNYNNEWDGKPNASQSLGNGLLPAGVYFIVLTLGSSIKPSYNGYVTIQY